MPTFSIRPRAHSVLPLLAAGLLAACGEPVTRTSPLPVDSAASTISAADIGELDTDGQLVRLGNDLRGMAVEFDKVDDAAHLDSTLMRLEEVGTDYRTIALKVDRQLQDGDEAARAALATHRAELIAARDALLAERDRMIAAYPDMERDVRETFDKFDFSFLTEG
ncbi:MAG: hypothetical protein WBA35_10770 [Litorimonas sp.]